MHTPKRLFALMYDAVTYVEGFKSWRPAIPAQPSKPWWHRFPGGVVKGRFTPGVHAFVLMKGTRISGPKGSYRLKFNGVLLLTKGKDTGFVSDQR